MVAMEKMEWMVANSIAIKTPTMVGPVVQMSVYNLVHLMEDLGHLKSAQMSRTLGEVSPVVKINQLVVMVMEAFLELVERVPAIYSLAATVEPAT